MKTKEQKHIFHVQAHRGASSEFQENTLPAFARAIELGVASVELDVHLSRDGEVVVYHDFELTPEHCFSQTGEPLARRIPVHALDFSQIETINIQNPKRLHETRKFSGEEARIPALREVIKLFKNSNCVIDVEAKSDPRFPIFSPTPEVFAKAVLELIKKEWDFDAFVLRSFDFRILKAARAMNPNVKIAALTGDGAPNFQYIVDALHPQILAPWKGTVSEELCTSAKKWGTQVIPYTANTPEDWTSLKKMGVSGVTTDDPKGLISYLKSLA